MVLPIIVSMNSYAFDGYYGEFTDIEIKTGQTIRVGKANVSCVPKKKKGPTSRSNQAITCKLSCNIDYDVGSRNEAYEICRDKNGKITSQRKVAMARCFE